MPRGRSEHLLELIEYVHRLDGCERLNGDGLERAAKLARAPATIFLIPALIPLVPGSYVYYMMSALVLNKLSTMRHYGQLTAEWAFGLAAGIGLIAVLHQIASWKPREKH